MAGDSASRDAVGERNLLLFPPWGILILIKTNITFYRCTSGGWNTGNASDGVASYWNKWDAGNRGTSKSYKTNSDNTTGSWQ